MSPAIIKTPRIKKKSGFNAAAADSGTNSVPSNDRNGAQRAEEARDNRRYPSVSFAYQTGTLKCAHEGWRRRAAIQGLLGDSYDTRESAENKETAACQMHVAAHITNYTLCEDTGAAGKHERREQKDRKKKKTCSTRERTRKRSAGYPTSAVVTRAGSVAWVT